MNAELPRGNGERSNPRRRATRLLHRALNAVLCLTLLTAHAAPAATTEVVSRALRDDPLRVLPPELAEGVRLPGDAAPWSCRTDFDPTQTLSLAAAVDLALCRDPQLHATWAAIKQQAQALGEARAAWLPNLSATTSQLSTQVHNAAATPADQRSRGQTLQATLTWRLFDFGGRAAQDKAAQLALVAALRQHDVSLQKTLSDVVTAYFDALAAQAVSAARHEALRTASATVATTERRASGGAVAQSDTLQARTALARAQLALQRAVGEQRKALAVLGFVLNLPGAALTAAALPGPSGAGPIGPSRPHPAAPESGRLEGGAAWPDLTLDDDLDTATQRHDLARWLHLAGISHPGILAARAAWLAAEARVDVVRAEGLPAIDFTANHYRNGLPNQGVQANRSTQTTWGISLSVPLFEGFARDYKIRGAAARAEQSAAQVAESERQVLSAVVKAHADAGAALANLDASEQLLEAATAALTSSEKRYALGAADIIELLNQQSALADARQERVRCLTDWRAARLRLFAAAGVLGTAATRAGW